MNHLIVYRPESHQNLPDGYAYAQSVGLGAIAALFTIHYPTNVSTADICLEMEELQSIGLQVADLAVTSAEDLVGYGRLTHDSHQGMMSDFVVSTLHRGKGIGRAIVDTQVALADQLGLTEVVIPKLASTNTIKHYYVEQHGFVETQQGSMIRRSPTVVTD